MQILDFVVTISEAQEKVSFSEATIRRWIEQEKITARQSGSVWLIDLPSLLLHVAQTHAVDFHHGSEKKADLRLPVA